MLKTVCRVAMCMAVSLSGFAQGQTPQAINYQASVRDNAGALLSNQELDVQFEIIQGADAASGTVVYSELHSDITTNAFGIFSLEIGNGAPQSGTMAGVSWSADKSFLRVKIDDDNDGNFDELTAQQLVSVPYSLSAENALKINGYPVGSAMPVVDQVLKWDGSAWVPNTDETGGGTGDITAVTVTSGGGLTGGGLSGDVVLDADNTNAMWNADQIQGTAVDPNLALSIGDVLKWDGTNWTAAQDDVGTGGSSPWTVTGNNIDYAVPGGFVGIGVANPAYKLDVAGQARFGGNVIGTGNITAGSFTTTGNLTLSGSILLNHPTPVSGGWIRGFTYKDASANIDAGFGLMGSGPNPTKLYMGHGATPWSTANGISILPNGNVGIGVISPLKEFHVDADTVRISSLNTSGSNQMLVIEPDGDVITQDIPSGGASGISAVNASSPLVSIENSGVVDLSVLNGSALWNANQLQGRTIGSLANLISGQILKWNGSEWSPAADEEGDNLGNHAATQNVELGDNYLSHNGANEGLQIAQSGGTVLLSSSLYLPGNIYYTPDPTTRIEISQNSYKFSVSSNPVYIQSNGVGIGIIPNISYRLRVNGSGWFNGDVVANNIAPSDKRFKKNLADLPNALERILQVKGHYYHWKTDEFAERNFNNGRDIGFIAQELEEIFPELVTTLEDGYKAVNYSKITPVLVEAIKELHALVQTQQEALDTSRQERAQLQEQIDLIMQQTGLNSKAEK